MRGRFRFAENLRFCRRINLIFLGKKVRRPFRDVFEELDLLLHDREHVAKIFFIYLGRATLCGAVDRFRRLDRVSPYRSNNSRPLEERPRQLDESIERHLGDVLAVKPKTFVQIECGVATVDFL